MKVFVVLVALAGTAAAGDVVSFPMSQIAGMLPKRPTEMRFVPGVGQLWRYGTTVVLFDGAWWKTLATIDAGSGMGGKHTEVQSERARLDVIARGEVIAFQITVTGKRRMCHHDGCDAWEPASQVVMCWREHRDHAPPQCMFE